ncbi:MAG: hypothetical protein ABSE72_04170 [Bacteroidales bacterium]|jgi:uncharacterized protein (DUF2132 family)
MSLLFLSYLALFCFQTQERPPVSFTEEYIEFRLRETTFTVNGIYYFVNNTANIVSKEISYPFPVPMFDIDSVHVFDIEQGRFLGFEKLRQAVVFRLNILPDDTVKLNIFYREKGVKDTVKYILTTTKNWGEPLKKAEYTFETERYRKIRSFNYPPDKTSHHNDQQLYFWNRKNFLPEKDFIVIFNTNP